MESTLHRQLKLLYGGSPADLEVQVDGFRIDAVVKGRLYEIQQASLSSLRDKVRTLLDTHRVVVVKPLVARKFLIRRDTPGGEIVSSRFSPLRQTILNVFEELVHFVNVFPHRRLTLEVVLIEEEEHRLTRPRKRRRGPDFKVEDRLLREVVQTTTLRTVADLRRLLPDALPLAFTTSDLAVHAGIPLWLAQKMAYCLRMTGAIKMAGKTGNSIVYKRPRPSRRAA